MATKPIVVSQRRISTLLGAVLVVSVLLGGWLFFSPVHAYSEMGGESDNGGSTSCSGRPQTVLRRDGGYGGGEYLTDQDAFDARCVAAAKHRLELAPIPAALAVLSAGALFFVRRRDPSRRRLEVPALYSFPR